MDLVATLYDFLSPMAKVILLYPAEDIFGMVSSEEIFSSKVACELLISGKSTFRFEIIVHVLKWIIGLEGILR